MVKERITKNQYSQNHPAGEIGKQLKMVKDIIVKDVPRIQIEDNIKISDVLLEMTKFKMGLCAILQDQTIFGIISDGDIRRLLVKNSEKKFITRNDINCDYIFESDLDKYVYKLKKITPVVIDKKLLGFIIPF